MVLQDNYALSVDGSLLDAAANVVHHSYRSFKKKYAKQKIKFERAMRQSNELFREDMKILELSKRLKEQNDQLLELLLELNNSLRVPPHLRYNLDVPCSPMPMSNSLQAKDGPTASFNVQTAREKLHEARASLLAGDLPPDACRRLEEVILRGEAFAPTMQFTSLLKVPHARDHLSVDGDVDSTLGFLSPTHEMEYSFALDSQLEGISASMKLTKPGDKLSSTDVDREAALRNPVSVYNWLRKHQPQVFLQDNEASSEKPGARPANTRTSKRAAAQVKKEDVYDEDGILLDLGTGGGGSARGKRKRDEDAGYRPKGGSGRSKKKKEDSSKRARRSSAANSTA